MQNTFYIDGHRVDQDDRFGDGNCWFELMLLPTRADVAGPFTPVEFARHRAWGLDPKWATRCALHAPMQDAADTYNGGFWPIKECDPVELIACGYKYGRT